MDASSPYNVNGSLTTSPVSVSVQSASGRSAARVIIANTGSDDMSISFDATNYFPIVVGASLDIGRSRNVIMNSITMKSASSTTYAIVCEPVL